MTKRAGTLLRLTVLAAALALAGCGRGSDANSAANLDNQLVGNDADPALTSALADQIAVDPQLTQQSNKNAVRPAEMPAQARYPAAQPAGGAAGAAPGAAGGTAAAPGGQGQVRTAAADTDDAGVPCQSSAPFDYNMRWAGRMSPVFPVYPGARVTEAAGNDGGNCRVRVVTFTTADDYQRVLDWYHTRAVRAGYSSEHQLRGSDHVLAGANQSDGGAFYLIATPRAEGAEVALIANNGR